ncbi:MAG: hypothetical protein J3Q66DRAFT_359622 [Benniella sp.]|nr:MAG: hypothetical protein J3Q66DRAFT_359622 [Benniella sp.]
MRVHALTGTLLLLLTLHITQAYLIYSSIPRENDALQDVVTAPTNTSLLECLAPLGSKVINRDATEAFEHNRYAFDLRFTFTPEVIIMASTAADVQAAVKCAKAANVPVAPRSGGHSFEGYSIGGQDGAMVIDLAGLSSVKVTGELAKVGSGVRLGPLNLELFKQGGLTVNAGTCPTVGIGGHALGGGFGLLARKYGLLIDRIVEMELVNADGDLLTVSGTQNPDLFFALRGAGGGSFGVVTSFTIQPIKPAPKVTSFSYSWGLAAHAQVLRAYVDFQAIASKDVGVEMTISSGGLELYGIFPGNKTQLTTTALAPFFEKAPPPSDSDVREGTHIDSVLRFSWLTGNPVDPEALSLMTTHKAADSRYTKGKSLVYPKPLLDSTIALLGKWSANNTAKGSTSNYIIIDLWGGAIQETPATATAFVHRDAHTVFEFVTEWSSGEGGPVKTRLPDCKPCIKYMDDMYEAFLKDYTQNYGPVRGYQNYIDKDIPKWEEAYYGSAFPRLKQIKAAADPSNVFRFNQSIPVR